MAKQREKKEKPLRTKLGKPYIGAGGARERTRKPAPVLKRKTPITLRIENAIILHSGGVEATKEDIEDVEKFKEIIKLASENIQRDLYDFLADRYYKAHGLTRISEQDILSKTQRISTLTL